MGGCGAEMSVKLRVPDRGDPFREPSPASLPPVLIVRALVGESPEGPACPGAACADYWVGRLERL